MIYQILALTRPLFVLDTETTGTDPQKDRIVEIAFEQWDASGMTKEWRSLANPGVPIPASATKVHHITDAMVQACRECNLPREMHSGSDSLLQIEGQPAVEIKGVTHEFKPLPTLKQLAPNLAKGLIDCDFAGQNVRFDLRILSAEFARADVEWSYVGARVIDSYQLERLAVPRSLSHLHEKYTGVKHDGAHGALSDVRAAATVIAKQLEVHDVLPRDLDQLHEMQWPGLIDPDGKFRFVDGVPCFGQWGKFANKPMRDADAGYWNFIIKADFSPDVKQLARNAKLGKFPEAR